MKKFILNQVLLAVIVLLSIFVLGLVVPLIVSAFVVVNTDILWINAITSPLFWIVSLFGWGIAAVYLNDTVRNSEDDE